MTVLPCDQKLCLACLKPMHHDSDSTLLASAGWKYAEAHATAQKSAAREAMLREALVGLAWAAWHPFTSDGQRVAALAEWRPIVDRILADPDTAASEWEQRMFDSGWKAGMLYASAGRNYLDLNSPDSERRLAAALVPVTRGLRVSGRPEEQQQKADAEWRAKTARRILAALKEEVVNAEVVIANEADIVADINDRARNQNWPDTDPQP